MTQIACQLCSSLLKNKILNNKLQMIKMYTFSTYTHRPKFTAILNSDAESNFEAGEKHRKHPGRRHIPCVQLPYHLEMSALKIISKYNSSQFREDVNGLFERVYHFHMPPEPSEINERTKEFAFQQANIDKIDIKSLDDDAKAAVLTKRDKKVQFKLKTLLRHSKPIEYNDYTSVAYLAARLPPNYATLFKVFSEIKHDDPDFNPKTLFDFGSGFGTSFWAANEVWPKAITEYFCVDTSSEMNDLSQLLFKGGDENKNMSFDGVFYRQFLPVSSNIKYDIVMSAFSLLELPDARNRIHVIENLWHKTQDLLVIVERGTRAGFAAVLEARNLILQMTGHDVTTTFPIDVPQKEIELKKLSEDAHIVAPCPHEHSCPRQFTGGPVLCNFAINYFPLNIGQKNYMTQRERFSYVVLRKGPKKSYVYNSWPRIVEPVIKHKSLSICRMCCSDGNIHEVNFTKSKHKGCAKISEWGDLIPAVVYKNDDVSYVNNDKNEEIHDSDDDKNDQ